jgi:hypothetical protein
MSVPKMAIPAWYLTASAVGGWLWSDNRHFACNVLELFQGRELWPDADPWYRSAGASFACSLLRPAYVNLTQYWALIKEWWRIQDSSCKSNAESQACKKQKEKWRKIVKLAKSFFRVREESNLGDTMLGDSFMHNFWIPPNIFPFTVDHICSSILQSSHHCLWHFGSRKMPDHLVRLESPGSGF